MNSRITPNEAHRSQHRRFLRLYVRILVLIAVSLGVLYAFRDTRTRRGPKSPDGFRTEVRVHGSGPTGGADQYADVCILDRAGRELAHWKNPHGPGSMKRVDHMVATMKWTKRDTLEFETDEGEHATLTIPVESPDK